MSDIVIPRLNANDDSYVLLEWLVPTGERVAAGDCVATIETSKAVSDLVAESGGHLVQRIAAGSVCRPGEIVGELSSTAPSGELHRPAVAQPVDTVPEQSEPVITRSAQELMDRHGISAAAVAALGSTVVREADVSALVGDGVGRPRQLLSAHQQAVARTVTLSHTTIPTAFAVVKVSATGVNRRIRRIGRQPRAFVGLVELFIKAVAELRDGHPHIFASLGPDSTLELAGRSDIGVTIDVGTGLFVPVVRDAATLDIIEIGRRLMALRVAAMRRQLRDDDLGPAALTIALHAEPSIVLARPIVFPGQVCTLALCAPQQELRLDGSGNVEAHEFFQVGMAYDHRVVNGRGAADFLTALRVSMEKSDPDG